MRTVLFIAAIVLMACGGPTPTPAPDPTRCPQGDLLLPWVVTQDEIKVSSCDRVAEVTSPAARQVHLVRGYSVASDEPVRFSANVEVISGSGRFESWIWQTSGANAMAALQGSGVLMVAHPGNQSGQFQLSIIGFADLAAPMRWRVSNVRIE